MLSRRIAYLLIILGSIGGLWWAVANVRFTTGSAQAPTQVAAPQPGRPVPIQVGQAPAGRIDYRRLDERLQRLAQRPNMVALAVGIVENGEIRFVKGYGETVAGSGERVTPATVFRWASLSKGVAGDMVTLLAHEGRLSLHDPINRYSSTLRLPGGGEAQARVSDVLSHTLGIPGHANDPKLEDGEDPRFLRQLLATLNRVCSPGQCHAYQNVAYDAASEVVERVSGRPYRDVVRDRLFLPLGMTSATMTREGLVGSASWARPYTGGRGGRPVEVTEHYYRVPAAGGVNSNIVDLARWMRAQMGMEPDILPGAVLNAVQAPRIRTPGENARRRRQRERILASAYGLGWRVYNYAGRRVIGHRGGVRGYRSLVMFDPELRTGVVALWNSSASQPGGLEFEVMDMLYGLPFHDWMEVDAAPAGAPVDPTPPETPDELMNQGAG